MSDRYPMYLGGEWVGSGEELTITNPFDGKVIGTTFQATRDQLHRWPRRTAVEASDAPVRTVWLPPRQMPSWLEVFQKPSRFRRPLQASRR